MNFVPIRSFDNYIHANMQLSILQEEGINCYLKDEYTITIDPLLSPAVGGIKLMVFAAQSERAEEIMDASDRRFLETVPCPHCGSHTLVLTRKVTQPVGLWQRLRRILVSGQAETVEQYYECSTCHSRYDQIPIQNEEYTD